ncbi:hypothetical protein ONS95_001618 [Cadophora gregata]|uniref:uncharacterized protein n=1 Tax=Cadophora gregata TaxID=51156 RepID=UPI0026DD2DB3|nr:uncharacterized protein ONS95_001618 [Cadophora gregata]KAK0111245.1 hypothetical protein ONS95_001618 [Cadophora gregata]
MSASASDVIRVAALAWEIYRMGWGEEFDASQAYQDFGNDIKGLAENLNNIVRVVENARATWIQESVRVVRSRAPPLQKDWDLSSLHEIVGDYRSTLEDCKRLLEQNYELESHNSKISILLKPLELNLLSDIHRDLADRIDAVHQSILHLHGLLIPDVQQAISEQGRPVSIPLIVPGDIERRFQTAAERFYPAVRSPGNFPLQAGADAFVAHINESTRKFSAGNFLNERTPPPKQYLSLLKCVWIMRCLQESYELRTAPDSSQWPGYIAQLNEDLSVECLRFTAPSAQRLIAPDLSSPRPDDEFSIWPGEDISEYISPHSEVYLEEILKLPMPSPSPTLRRTMTVYKLDATKYRLVESIEDSSGPTERRQEYKMEIDLRTVNLTPIYATPSSRPKSMEVQITSSSANTNPTFQEHKQMMRFQHLLTGYQVFDRYDQAMVTASFFISGQEKPIEEHARIQIWLPHPFASSSKSANTSTSTTPNALQSPSSSTFQGPTTQNPMRSNTRDSLNASMESMTIGRYASMESMTTSRSRDNRTPSRLTKSSSRASLGTGRESATIGNSREDVRSSAFSMRSFTNKSRQRPPSVMTTSSTTSRRSTATSITTISTGAGNKAHLHTKPAKPLLVIFLKGKDAAAKLAIVAIQMDDKTEVKRERCGCRSSNSDCRYSCIERSDGPLMIQRWDAEEGLGSWNLAKLGVDQRKELPADAWNNVKRVSLHFNKTEDRYTFSGSPCACKPKMQHDLARCILERHHGIFGVVKQIGSQRLRNYHQERDKATGENMVMGALPEDEEW